jgi:hypothetical protein
VDVSVGTSFISIEQARANLGSEVPNVAAAQSNELQTKPGNSLESTARCARTEWAELLDRIEIKAGEEEGAEEMKQVFWMGVGVVRLLQVRVPFASHFRLISQTSGCIQHSSKQLEANKYWSQYNNRVHEGPPHTLVFELGRTIVSSERTHNICHDRNHYALLTLDHLQLSSKVPWAKANLENSLALSNSWATRAYLPFSD